MKLAKDKGLINYIIHGDRWRWLFRSCKSIQVHQINLLIIFFWLDNLCNLWATAMLSNPTILYRLWLEVVHHYYPCLNNDVIFDLATVFKSIKNKPNLFYSIMHRKSKLQRCSHHPLYVVILVVFSTHRLMYTFYTHEKL